MPGTDEEPKEILVVFMSTPDQFAARLSIAHDKCIRHSIKKVLLVNDYFDNQALRHPASTFQAIHSSRSVEVAMMLYSSFGYHFLPLLVAKDVES